MSLARAHNWSAFVSGKRPQLKCIFGIIYFFFTFFVQCVTRYVTKYLWNYASTIEKWDWRRVICCYFNNLKIIVIRKGLPKLLLKYINHANHNRLIDSASWACDKYDVDHPPDSFGLLCMWQTCYNVWLSPDSFGWKKAWWASPLLPQAPLETPPLIFNFLIYHVY